MCNTPELPRVSTLDVQEHLSEKQKEAGEESDTFTFFGYEIPNLF